MRLLLLSQFVQVADGIESKRLRGETHHTSMAKCDDGCESCLRNKVRKVTRDKVPLCTGMFLQKRSIVGQIDFEALWI